MVYFIEWLSDPRSKISFYWWIDRIFLNYINNFPLKRLKIGFIIIRTPTCVLMIRTIPNFITVYNILTETVPNNFISDNKIMPAVKMFEFRIKIVKNLVNRGWATEITGTVNFFEPLVKSSMLSRRNETKIR